MKKKYFWVIVAVLTVASIVSFLVWDELETNIRRYSVYYAKHIPHGKDTDPVLAMTMENLDYLNRPNLKNYSYYSDALNSIMVGDAFDFSTIGSGYMLEKLHEPREVYYFTPSGKFDSYILLNEDKTAPEVSDMRKREAFKFAYDILQPIIDSQPIPGINLQWYFNWKYQKRFE